MTRPSGSPADLDANHKRRSQLQKQKATTDCKVSSDKESQASAEAKDASQPPRPSNPEPSMATVPAETGAADHNKSEDGDLAQARDAAQSTQPSGDVVFVETD